MLRTQTIASAGQQHDAALAPSQRVGAPSTFKVSVNELHLTCIAQDGHGASLRGLTASDFTVLIDQQPARVRAVGSDADAPLNVALLLDVSLSQKGMLGLYGDALHGLIAALDKARDQIAIYTFGSDVRLYQDWQPVGAVDPDGVRALDSKKGKLLEKHPFYTHGGTRLFDAVSLALEGSSQRQGRNAILVLTDGIDEGSSTSSANLVKIADQGDVSVSALEFHPSGLALLSPSLPFKQMHDSLALTSHVTGGVFLHQQPGQERKQLETIIEVLKAQYILYLLPPTTAPGVHSVSIGLTPPQPGLVFTHHKIWRPEPSAERP